MFVDFNSNSDILLIMVRNMTQNSPFYVHLKKDYRKIFYLRKKCYLCRSIFLPK